MTVAKKTLVDENTQASVRQNDDQEYDDEDLMIEVRTKFIGILRQ
jgi:hypothetical protein